jgi:hypothetical protein
MPGHAMNLPDPHKSTCIVFAPCVGATWFGRMKCVRIALLAVVCVLASGPAFGQAAAPTDKRFAGGDGRNCETAVVLQVETPAEVVSAEDEWLAKRYPDGFKFDQRLFASPDKKHWFDVIVLRKGDGALIETCFDFTREHDAYLEKLKSGVPP